MEFECSFGTAVLYVDVLTGQARQPVTDSDSHFMAWQSNGNAAYLKVDMMNRPHIILAPVQGGPANVPITELSYDVSPQPGADGSFLFSFSRGMGLGSEMWHAMENGQVVKQVTADKGSYVSFARWSPDASRIAFIKIPDSATPFTVGELWLMQADGSAARKLADADAGHGFAEDWSPDGTRLVFVVRENPNDPQADQQAAALQSNLMIVDARTGAATRVTQFSAARVEAPAWSPDGKRIVFTAVLDDTMNVYIADIASGQVEKVLTEAACCPIWIRK
jgi:Tol biopolymer transport system component